MKSYFFVYSTGLSSRLAMRAALDMITEVKEWRIEFENTFFIRSESSATELSELIRDKFVDPSLTEKIGNVMMSNAPGRFLIMEIPDNINGLLTTACWSFIQGLRDKKNDTAPE